MDYNKQMVNRINRIQGQLNGVIKMMEEKKIVKTSLHNSVHQRVQFNV